MSEQQAIEVRAVPPRVPREAKPARPTVPLRRAIISTLDVAALAATGAVAEFGAVGVLAGAGAAVGVPMAARAVRRRQERQVQRQQRTSTTTRTTGSGGGRMPSLGGGSGGRTPGAGGGRSAGRTGTSTGAGSGGIGAAGRRLRNLLGGGRGSSSGAGSSGSAHRGGAGSTGAGNSSGRATRRGGAGSAGGRPSSGSGGSGPGTGGGRRTPVRGPLGVWDRLAGRDPSPRQARRNARKLVDGLAKDTTRRQEWADRRAERRARRRQRKPWWKRVWRGIVGPDLPANKKPATGERTPVGTQLRGTCPPSTTQTAPAPSSKAAPIAVPGRPASRRTPVAITSPAMRAMLACAEEMKKIAVKHNPDGNLEVLADYQGMPHVLAEVLAALDVVHKKAADQDLHKAVVDYVGSVVKAQRSTMTAAEAVAPAIEKLHADELAYLRKGGSTRWDRGTNNGSAAPARGRRPATAPSSASPTP